MSRQILAIDIHQNSLAAVLLNTGLKSNTIQAYTQVPLATESANGNALQTALISLREELGAPQVSTVVALPADQAIFRTLQVPFKEEKKIRQILPFELEPALPVAVDGLAIDFQKITDAESTEILTAAMDRKAIQHYLEAFSQAGLPASLAVPGGFPVALELVHYAADLPDQALLLDLDAQKTTLFAIWGRRIALVRTLPYHTTGEAATEALALRVRQTLTAFAETRAASFKPELIYLNGPHVADGKDLHKIQTAFEAPVQVLDLRHWLSKIESPQNEDRWQPWRMNGALALAWLEAEGKACINFHRSSSPLRNLWSAYRPYVRGPAILLATVLVLGIAGVLVDSHRLKKQADRLNSDITAIFKGAFPDIQRIVDPVAQMRAQIEDLKKAPSIRRPWGFPCATSISSTRSAV